MAQFNVYRNLNTASKKVTPYFLHVLLANESGNVALSAWAKLMRWESSIFIACLALASAAVARADVSDANSAAQLRAKYVTLKEKLNHNQFQLPLYLDSQQSSGDLRGDIYAVVDHPFATVGSALKGAPQWCNILFLHLNVKYCRATEDKQGSGLTVFIGRKYDQPLVAALRVEFSYKVAAENSDYLQIILNAQKGPLRTKNYRIMLEAIPQEGKTFIHLSYSYAYGVTARLATQAYFSTLGSDKVGFTIVGKQSDGQPIYVEDMRAALERNTMRYYLAIDAYLDALSAPSQEQLEKRLRNWFASTERYALQLHEVTQGDYLDMKRKEYKRQQTTHP